MVNTYNNDNSNNDDNINNNDNDYHYYYYYYGNCEEELPKKLVGRQVTDSLPTVYQQVTDRLRKKKNCVKNEQLT